MKRKTFVSVLSFLTLLATFVMFSCKKNIQKLTNYNDRSGYTASALRTGPSDPEVQRIRDNLKTLAMGLIEISADSSIKNLVYQNISVGEITDTLAKYYFVSLDTLFAQTEGSLIDIRKEMNNTINKINRTNAHKDNLTGLLNDMVFQGIKVRVNIFIPYLNTFDAQDLEKNPLLAPLFLEEDYPVFAFPSGPIKNGAPLARTVTRDMAKIDPIWLIAVNIPAYCYMDGDGCNTVIVNCTGIRPTNTSDQCEVCPPSTTVGGVGIGNYIGIHSFQNYEIKLVQGINDDATVSDNCLSTDLSYPCGSFNPPSYAVLSIVPGVNYWENVRDPSDPLDTRRIKRLPLPIMDRGLLLSDPSDDKLGDVLTLCCNQFWFNVWGKSGTRHALGFGGVYKIERLNQLPFYFAFPTGGGAFQPFWLSGSPDIAFFYGVNKTGVCPSGKQDIEENYKTNAGGGISFSANIFGFGTEHYASTDASFMLSYWRAQVIDVGFSFAGELIDANHYHSFAAVTNPGPVVLPSNITLVGQLLIQSDGSYEVSKKFFGQQSFSVGDNLIIHVRANYGGGKGINEFVTIPLQSTVKEIHTFIRGNILNRSTDYVMDIYKIN